MINQDEILDHEFELNDGETPKAETPPSPADQAGAGTLTSSMSLLRRIPVTVTLEVSSVEMMLADLLNMDDDTVIELDKLAGEPLDIKVNNILLGKAEVVVVNEKYGLRVLEFNPRDINELTR